MLTPIEIERIINHQEALSSSPSPSPPTTCHKTTRLTGGVGDSRSNLPTSPATDDDEAAPPPPPPPAGLTERPAKSWLGLTDDADADADADDAVEVEFWGDVDAEVVVVVEPAKSWLGRSDDDDAEDDDSPVVAVGAPVEEVLGR